MTMNAATNRLWHGMDPRVRRFAVCWSLLGLVLAVLVSVPALVLLLAVTTLASAFLKVGVENDALRVTFGLVDSKLHALLRIVNGLAILALAIAGFVVANTSLLGLLL